MIAASEWLGRLAELTRYDFSALFAGPSWAFAAVLVQAAAGTWMALAIVNDLCSMLKRRGGQ